MIYKLLIRLCGLVIKEYIFVFYSIRLITEITCTRTAVSTTDPMHVSASFVSLVASAAVIASRHRATMSV